MPLLILFFMLLAANIPIWVYAWLYMRVPNLVAGGLYLVVLMGLCVLFSQVIGRLKKEPPEAVFGCVAMISFFPGIYLGIFQAVPYLQLRGVEPALSISVESVSEHQEAAFFSFSDAFVGGPFQYWHSEERSSSRGEKTTHWTAHFQVVPVVGREWKQGQAPLVWLTSQAEEESAFPSDVQRLNNLSGLRLVKPDRGFRKAILKACEKGKLAVPEDPVLLEKTGDFDSLLQSHEDALGRWLLGYNVVFLVLALVGWMFIGRPKGNPRK